MITGPQIREARALLGLHRSQLAAKAGVVTSTVIRRIEADDGEPGIEVERLAALRRSLEKAGIEFITGDDGVPCVCLREPDPR